MPADPANFGLQGFAFPVVTGGPAVCDYPGVGDVRYGVAYSNGALVGTLYVPGTVPTNYGLLAHSPADVLRWAMIDMGLGSRPRTAGQHWPIFAAQEPNAPDDVITVYDTTGSAHGRTMVDGELQGHYGVQIRFRAVNHKTGWVKANAVMTALAESLRERSVTVEGSQYVVQNAARIGDVIPLGAESPTSQRMLFTLNLLVSLWQLNP